MMGYSVEGVIPLEDRNCYVHRNEAENRTIKIAKMIDAYTSATLRQHDAEIRPSLHRHVPDETWQLIARVAGYEGASEETIALVKKALDQRPKLIWDVLSRAT